MGIGYELDVIAAVVLGGTSIFGGSGTIWGTVIGLVMIQLLKNGLALTGVKGDATIVVIGVALILSVLDREFPPAPPRLSARFGVPTPRQAASREESNMKASLLTDHGGGAVRPVVRGRRRERREQMGRRRRPADKPARLRRGRRGGAGGGQAL